MNRQRKLTRAVAVLAGLSLVVAACGGDDDDTADDPVVTEAPDPDDPDPTDPDPDDPDPTDPDDTDPPVTDPDDEPPPPDDGMLVANPQDINRQPREALQEGGEFRYPIGSIAENWNGNHPAGNEVDYSRVRGPMEFRAFIFDAEGVPRPDTNFVLDAQLDEGPPQTVTYQLNPDAVWNNGEPIGIDDFVALWQARNGEDESFQVVSTEGYDQIVSIEQGADEHEVVVTFDPVYADWQGLFGGMTYRDSVADPDTFNNGWGQIEPDWFTGPFTFDSLDEAQQVIELVPNPNWWGDPPLLDRIIFRVVSLDAQPQAFANDELDAVDIGPDPDGFQIASAAPHADIRTALGPSFRHITFNHEAGLIQELEVRQAISRGLDREDIGISDLAGIPWPVEPLNNRILMSNQEGYQDNAEGFDYDPDAARSTLEDAGWEVGADGIYERDGERLTVRFTQISGVPVSENEAQLVQAQLGDIGIEVEIVSIAIADFSEVLFETEFEMIAFSWIGSPFPFAGVAQIYGTGGDSNYANSNIPELDALTGPLASELDLDARIEMANEADRILWEQVHTLPLYQRPDIYAVHRDFANFGAFGLIRIDWAAEYENWGWM